MTRLSTEKIELAAQFVNSTASHIFLTGKAGTGKTTFLRDLAEATHKDFVIVAPTGIAALNAKGVTIHSQFLFPFGTFLQDEINFKQAPKGNFYTRNQLARRHPLNSARKQVLRNIDLLIIDEISMVRADLLDAIDYRLKSVKGNFKQAFGGVQLLMIGDLYQLQPIVKPHEWEHLKAFYKSPHFFESSALKTSGFTYIELDKIFRQQDNRFINILNHIRDNVCTDEDIDILNSYFVSAPTENEKEGAIIITTHNYKADSINKQELDKLPGKSHFYKAEIAGEFPEHIYPLPQTLELKKGAKVMFIKNDGEEKRYFNGKLAEISQLSSRNEICVKMEGEDEFWLESHRWENIKYNIHPKTKEIEEEVIGSFDQYPIKPAWAITVHKSQGLTFEKAIIDVEQAFAAGQVYVALSRLRSLEGLVLRNKISKSVISSDEEVVRFSESKTQQPPLQDSLKTSQMNFLKMLLLQSFDFSEIINQIEYTQNKFGVKMEFEDEEMQTALQKLKESFLAEKLVTNRFKIQITKLLQENQHEKLLERIEKGSNYYLRFLNKHTKELLIHLEEVRQLSRTKTYQNALAEIDQIIVKKLEQVQKSAFVCRCILEGKQIKRNEELRFSLKEKRLKLLEEVKIHLKENPKNLKNKTGRKRKNSTKGETYQTTFTLLKEGLSPQKIAEKRGLVLGTIEVHLAKGIEAGNINIESILKKEELKELESVFESNPDVGLAEIYQKTSGNYSYGKLRMFANSLKRKNTSREAEQ